MPDSLVDQSVSPEFTSPLDRLRQMGQLVGAQRMVEFASLMVQTGIDPAALSRIDADELMELAQHVLGAPAKSLKPRSVSEQSRTQLSQMADTATAIQGATGAGQAAEALGKGAAAAAGGAEALRGSPAITQMLQQLGNRPPQAPQRAAA